MWTIENVVSGRVLGTYPGATALDAYQAMMRDAGYRDAAAAASAGFAWDDIPAALRIEPSGGDTWRA